MATAMNIEEISSRIIKLEVGSNVTTAELREVLRQINLQNIEVIDAINVEFAQIRNRIDTIIHDTNRDLNDLKAGQVIHYNDLFSCTEAAVDNFARQNERIGVQELGRT